MSPRPVLLVTLWLLAGNAVAAAGDSGTQLGRLFFTPEKRAILEHQRQLNLRETQAFESSDISLDGIVVRSSGKRTVWINNRAQNDSAAPAGVTADVAARPHGQAVLQSGDEAPARLKVGESINRTTRETAGGLTQGQISVHRSPPPQR